MMEIFQYVPEAVATSWKQQKIIKLLNTSVFKKVQCLRMGGRTELEFYLEMQQMQSSVVAIHYIVLQLSLPL